MEPVYRLSNVYCKKQGTNTTGRDQVKTQGNPEQISTSRCTAYLVYVVLANSTLQTSKII